MYCLPHFQLSWALKKWSSFIILWCTMGCLLTLQWWWMGKTWANTERWANQQAPNGKEEEQENKPASPAARRPFPMQVHQCTTSTYSAKVPLLLNQLWNLDVFSNLDCLYLYTIVYLITERAISHHLGVTGPVSLRTKKDESLSDLMNEKPLASTGSGNNKTHKPVRGKSKLILFRYIS